MTTAPSNPTMLADLRDGLSRHRLWRFMAWRETLRQYKRTALGVVWIPLNVLLHVAVLGAVYTLVFDGGGRYFAYFALSFSVWKPFGQMLGIAAGLWPASEKYVKHLPAPVSLFVLRTIYRVAIVFALSLPVGVILALATGARPGWGGLLALPGALLFLANASWITVGLSVLALRYRDVRRLVPTSLFVIFLCTPIMWEPQRLGEHQWIAQVNPLYHMISVIRDPVLEGSASALSWGVCVAMAVIGNWAAWAVLGAVRRRIPLWL